MRYLPKSDEERRQMLAEIGAASMDDLFASIPAEYRFKTAQVYIKRDSATGALILSEKPLRPSLDAVFAALDAAGAAEFELDRDLSPPVKRNWM